MNQPQFTRSPQPPAPPAKLPRLLAIVMVLTFLPWFGFGTFLGFNMAGWAWVLALCTSVIVLLSTQAVRITFPLGLWTLWAILLIVYRIFWGNHPDSLQTLVQMLTPLFVGCAISTCRYTTDHLELVYSWLTKLFYIALVMVAAKNTSILLGRLPTHGSMTPETTTCCLLASFYVAFYSAGSPRHLLFYLGMLIVPGLMMTRGPLLSAASAFILSLSPLRLKQRLLLGALLAVVALMVFYSPRFQKRMFYSGSGTIQDVRWDNDNFASSGRKAMWIVLLDSWKKQPWTGHGLNASRTALLDAGYTLYLPHNDWLKLLHDLGIIGVSCLGAAMCVQVLSLLRLARQLKGKARALAYAAASAFIPFTVLMLTDNVTLYVQYYSNLHFAIIGVVYSFTRNERNGFSVAVPQTMPTHLQRPGNASSPTTRLSMRFAGREGDPDGRSNRI